MSDGLSGLNYPIRLCYHYYADQKGKPTRKIPLHKGDIGGYVFVDDCLADLSMFIVQNLVIVLLTVRPINTILTVIRYA